MKSDVEFDNFFLMGLPERKKILEWLEIAIPTTVAQTNFLNRVRKALETVKYDYYIAAIEPSFDEGKNITYKEGEPVAVGLTGRQWMQKAKVYYNHNHLKSGLALLEEGDLFKAYRVAMGYWSLEYICDDSSLPSISSKVGHEIAYSGKTEIGGFSDGVGNTFEIYRDKGGIALVGGFFLNFGKVNTVAKALRFHPNAVSQYGRGVISIKVS